MKLKSIYVFKRIVEWRTAVLNVEGFINMLASVGTMNHKMQVSGG
jgi:hypothetical protein